MRKNGTMHVLVHLSKGEEVGNSLTHGVMSTLLLILLPAVAIHSYLKGGTLLAAGTSVFIISIFLMTLASCLYHAMAYETKHKYVFRILDHIFIYVAIAGSYTPIALYVIGGWQGWLILVIQWAMVLFGVLYKSITQKSVPKLSVLIYLCMGWTAVFFIPTIIHNATWEFLGLILLGGLMYSIGSWFYMQKSRPYFHLIWHVFINLAALSHFIAIVFFI